MSSYSDLPEYLRPKKGEVRVIKKEDARLATVEQGPDGKIFRSSLTEPMLKDELFDYEGDRYKVLVVRQAQHKNFFMACWSVTAEQVHQLQK